MRPIAFLISSNVVRGRPEARADCSEFEKEFAAIDAPCREAGFALQPVIWDEALDAGAFDGVIVGTTWDYWDKQALFLSTLDAASRQAPVMNPARVIRWNLDKSYLRDLASAGAPGIETLWVDRADPVTIESAFDVLGADDLVIKPLVGGGAWRQARVRRGEPLPTVEDLPPAEAMIQPFLSGVAREGEYSLLFFGGRFSHALNKRPRAGDYRVQSIYGASEAEWSPDAAMREAAEQVLDAARRVTGEADFLYARVDLVRGDDGGLLVMELEMIEPYFYPEQGPDMGRVFAAALSGSLG
ncbi:MAG: hypothetical protein AAFX09_05965 [Pseudomonadota bacterium]